MQPGFIGISNPTYSSQCNKLRKIYKAKMQVQKKAQEVKFDIDENEKQPVEINLVVNCGGQAPYIKLPKSNRIMSERISTPMKNIRIQTVTSFVKKPPEASPSKSSETDRVRDRDKEHD